ncbi:hypothetical protein [Capnocytophaga gingivalis]|uniref:hypothetical protein n=1 Tax=Capnocytophaga gingivalis TaxID=1017 RepID=UPI00288B4B21|nr:hypothetical protein [Capnocytophaga gingivalis]
MKNWILFLILMVCCKNYAQVPPLVVGYEYIGRNTFHTGITGEIRLDEDKKYTFFGSTGVHLTGFQGSTRGIFELSAALKYRHAFAGATYTPYAIIPKVGVGTKDIYAYAGYVIPTDAYASGDNNPLREGVAVGINVNLASLIVLPVILVLGCP